MSTNGFEQAPAPHPTAVDEEATRAVNTWGGWCHVAIGTVNSTCSGEPEQLITVTDLDDGRVQMGLPEAWEVAVKILNAMNLAGTDLHLLRAVRRCATEVPPGGDQS